MLLKNKNAIVYGAGGFIGGAVARAFAREGAKVFLAGRTLATLDKVAEEISAAGGAVETAQVDAFDEKSVDTHADEVAHKEGSIDISFNAVMYGDVQQPLFEMTWEDCTGPIMNAVKAQYLTSNAAARHMTKLGSGVILTITGYGPPTPRLGNTGVIWSAVESLCRQWASDLGPKGIRVAWLRTAGTRESILDAPDYGSSFAGDMSPEELLSLLEEETMLKRLPSLDEVGNMAAFLASDQASSMTATALNITGAQ